MHGVSSLPARDAPTGRAWNMAGALIAAGVFLASYVSWRPADILFTASDAMFVLGTGFLLAAHRAPLQPFGRATPWWLLATTALLLGLFVGSIVNGDPDRWLIAGAQYGFSLVVLPLLLMSHDSDRTFKLMKALIAGVVAMEAFGVVVYFGLDLTYEEYSRFGHEFITGGERLGAFLGDANWNGAAIVMAAPFALYLRLRQRIGLPVFCAIMAILLVGLFLAASVTGLTSGILSILIFSIVGRVRPPYRFMLGAALAIGLLFASGYGLPHAFEKRIAPAIEEGDFAKAGTYVGRMELIREAWQIVEGTTFVGLGVDQYREVSVDKAPVHNLFLLLWAEGGLLALAGWITLLGIVAGVGFAARRTDRLAAALGLSVFSTFVIYSSAAPHMYARLWMVPLLLAMAPAFVINAAKAPRKKRPSADRGRIRASRGRWTWARRTG
jgi:hypothetical protein